MKTIVMASTNPVKIEATRQGFERMFPKEAFRVQSVRVPSGVRGQPLSSDETMRGAKHRVEAASERLPQADYWVGIEGGIEWDDGEAASFSWVVVKSGDGYGKSRTGLYYLPPKMGELIRAGKELGEANDLIFSTFNSKQGRGAVGLLTDGVLDRTQLYEHAVILALVPFKNATLYDRDPGASQERQLE